MDLQFVWIAGGVLVGVVVGMLAIRGLSRRPREIGGGTQSDPTASSMTRAGADLAAAAMRRPNTGLGASEQEVRALAAAGQKIQAIRRVRELTGLGLKEAKDYVERLA